MPLHKADVCRCIWVTIWYLYIYIYLLIFHKPSVFEVLWYARIISCLYALSTKIPASISNLKYFGISESLLEGGQLHQTSFCFPFVLMQIDCAMWDQRHPIIQGSLGGHFFWWVHEMWLGMDPIPKYRHRKVVLARPRGTQRQNQVAETKDGWYW